MSTGGARIRAVGPISGRVAAPASKSMTNRALVMAALADGDSVLRGPLASNDTVAMRTALAQLGSAVDVADDCWRIQGTGGRLRSPPDAVDARLSGTTMRFVAALATLAPHGATVTGMAPLLTRPVGALVDGLRQLGARITCEGDYPPVHAGGGGLAGGRAVVDASASSQFASAILLAAPYAHAPVTLQARGAAAVGYIDLTADMLRAWGEVIARPAVDVWEISAPGGHAGRETVIEYDASAAAHLYALAMATRGSVTVTNASAQSAQPDAAIADVFASMGGVVTRDADALTVTGPDVLKPVDIDLRAMPDQVTTIAALAALADGVSEIRGVGVTRGHETDRLTALATELAKVDVAVEQRADGVRIHGGKARRGHSLGVEPGVRGTSPGVEPGVRGTSPGVEPVRLLTYQDHRLAMAFTALGANIGGVVVDDYLCVAKTYPRFWDDAGELGLAWEETAV